MRDGFEKKFLETELNSLKIAEHRDFADCARYILTTLLTLCLPAPPRAKAEYRSLFPETAPNTATQVSALLLAHIVVLICGIKTLRAVTLSLHQPQHCQSSEATLSPGIRNVILPWLAKIIIED